MGERRQNSLGRSAVVESPDTFRSRPESKKPFQLHLRTNLADSNWYVVAHTLPRYIRGARTYIRDTRSMALYVLRGESSLSCSLRFSLSLSLSFSLSSLSPPLSPRRSFCVSRSSKRVREAASYMIHSLYKNNRLL